MFERHGPHAEGVEGLGQQGHLAPELRLLREAAASSHPSAQEALEREKAGGRPGSAQLAFLQTSSFQNCSARPESERKILTAPAKGMLQHLGEKRAFGAYPKKALLPRENALPFHNPQPSHPATYGLAGSPNTSCFALASENRHPGPSHSCESCFSEHQA